MTQTTSSRAVFRLPGLLGPELATRLEGEITQLRLAPGAKLGEEDLCDRFGVSRSPVREALQILAGYGLVERHPRRGMFVAPLSCERLDEIYACRKPLEGLAAAGAAEAATPQFVAEFRRLLDDMSGAQADLRPDDAFAANVALTSLLHECCGNETLRRILVGLDRQALRYRFYCYKESWEIVAASLAANEALLAAIQAGSAESARSTTEALVSRSWTLIRSALVADAQLGINDA